MVPSLIIEVLNDLVVPSLIIDKSTGIGKFFFESIVHEKQPWLGIPHLKANEQLARSMKPHPNFNQWCVVWKP